MILLDDELSCGDHHLRTSDILQEVVVGLNLVLATDEFILYREGNRE